MLYLGHASCERFPQKPYIIPVNPLLTKFVQSRWLDIDLILFLCVYQTTENLETDIKKSGDFSKNLEIDRPADKTKSTQVLIKIEVCFFSCL